jgi:hypothetical protein
MRPITFQMANTLHHVITTRGRGTAFVENSASILVRRGLLEEVQNTERRFRPTQLGRETLSQYYWAQNSDTVVQPNVVVRCYWWQDFNGLHAELYYLDDDRPARLDWTQSLMDNYAAVRFVLEDLTRVRHFLLACCPENHNPDLEGE